MRYLRAAFATFFVALIPLSSFGAIDYSSIGSTYPQNFNGLQSTGQIISWDDFGIPGWSLFRVPRIDEPPQPVAIGLYDASDGSHSDARFYSFGAQDASSAERALGSIGNAIFGDAGSQAREVPVGSVAGWMAASFTNSTGTTLNEFTVEYDGEQWRDGGNGPGDEQTMVFEYGFGPTFTSVGTWTAPGDDFNFISPVSGSGGAVNGNGAGRTADLGGTVPALWAPGDTLWLRWVELNDGGLDHGLAIDDFSFTATATAAVPEPTATLFGCLICGLGAIAWLVRRIGAGLTANIMGAD